MKDWKDRKHWNLVSKTSGQLFVDWDGEYHNNINLSSEWSTLVKEAGKCESYNSDIFIDYNSFMSKMKTFAKGNAIPSFDSYIGIRRMGVDHEYFIDSRMESNTAFYYNIFWFHVERDEDSDTYVNVELYKYSML